jgi:hypothetical protein
MAASSSFGDAVGTDWKEEPCRLQNAKQRSFARGGLARGSTLLGEIRTRLSSCSGPRYSAIVAQFERERQRLPAAADRVDA